MSITQVSKIMKKIVVKFKETYLDIPVTRECIVSSLEDVIKIYELNNDDIEYWEVIEETEI